jgi:hypothetical protein
VIWPFVTGTEVSATLWLVLATIGLVAVPAHAFVVGFQRAEAPGARSLDVALLARIGAWLASGVVTALLVAAVRVSA